MSTFLRVGAIISVVLCVSLAPCAVASDAEVTVWLLPAEPGLQPSSVDEAPTDEDVDRITAELVPAGVTLENIADPRLRAQLGAWNAELAVPNLAWLRGQTITLKAIGRFAAANHVRVRIRFWTWSGIFAALRAAIVAGGQPDVSQVGSGWVAFFSKARMLAPLGPRVPPELRRDYLGVSGVALRYTSDLRFIYYWRRLPRAGSPVVSIERSSWEAFVQSLESQSGPPFAFPIGATQNIIHDLLPILAAEPAKLFHSGVTGPYLLLPASSMEVPILFAKRSLIYDKRGLPRRVIAFPEVAHEEALRSFTAGGYSGIIEPVGFLRRWIDEFSRTAAKQPGVGSFWEHAGVLSPPAAFKGGSDLVVFNKPGDRELARKLALFLASDPQYARVLAENGNLPVALGPEGVRLLLAPISNSPEAKKATEAIKHQIELTNSIGAEEPAMPEWPIDVEHRETIESFQNVWRRISDGDPDAVKRSFADLSEVLNVRLNGYTRAKQLVFRIWPVLSAVLLGVVGVIAWEIAKRGKQSEAARIASEKARKIQGFTAAALGVVDKIHRRKGPFKALSDDGIAVAEKSALVAVGLSGWLRGLDRRNWEPEAAENVVWRAVLLAMDFQRLPGIFERYSAVSGGGLSIAEFLRREKLLRSSRPPSSENADYFFEVTCAENVTLDQPFMIEQCLTCLLQNTLTASEVPSGSEYGFNTFLPIDIKVAQNGIAIRNSCSRAFSPLLAETLSEDQTVDEFADRVRALLSGPVTDRPGLGTILSTLIARECYGGLNIAASASETVVNVWLVSDPHSRWASSKIELRKA